MAVVVMERALITRDWSLAYVQKVGSPDTPALFNFTALWSALEGSILLWLLLLAVYTAVIVGRYRARLARPPGRLGAVVMLVVTAFFFFLALGPTDAFREGFTPANFDLCCKGPQPPVAEPRAGAVPPADPLPRLRRLHGAVRLRHRRARSPAGSARGG